MRRYLARWWASLCGAVARGVWQWLHSLETRSWHW
jgi:hypothetical protein